MCAEDGEQVSDLWRREEAFLRETLVLLGSYKGLSGVNGGDIMYKNGGQKM